MAPLSAPDSGKGSGDGIVVIDGDNLNSAKDLVYDREPHIVMKIKNKDNEGNSKAISQVDGNAKKKSGVPGVYATTSTGRWVSLDKFTFLRSDLLTASYSTSTLIGLGECRESNVVTRVKTVVLGHMILWNRLSSSTSLYEERFRQRRMQI